MADHVTQKVDGWYWYDETGEEIGPFRSEAVAHARLTIYSDWLEHGPDTLRKEVNVGGHAAAEMSKPKIREFITDTLRVIDRHPGKVQFAMLSSLVLSTVASLENPHAALKHWVTHVTSSLPDALALRKQISGKFP